MHNIHYLSLGILGINLIILALLLSIYVKNYRHIKSRFNLGLIAFSLLFFIENVTYMAVELMFWTAEAFDIAMYHIVLINIIELLGLLTLLFITRE
jgi:hypothetical protein